MTKNNTKQISIFALREQFRTQAAELASQLARSVGRVTSVDLAACPEYREEVRWEYGLVDRLLYVQNCRSALERAIQNGSSRLVWRWTSGRVSEVSFRREHNQIQMRVREKDGTEA